MSEITKKSLLNIPKRKWNEPLKDIHSVYVIPSGRKHDSGYNCMDFIAEGPDGLIRFGGGCDDVSFEGSFFRMDCMYPSGIVHIWNRKGFSISPDVSSISFEENK